MKPFVQTYGEKWEQPSNQRAYYYSPRDGRISASQVDVDNVGQGLQHDYLNTKTYWDATYDLRPGIHER